MSSHISFKQVDKNVSWFFSLLRTEKKYSDLFKHLSLALEAGVATQYNFHFELKLWGSEKSTAFTTIDPDSFLKCVFPLVSRTPTLLGFFLSPRARLMKTLRSILLFLMSVLSLTTQTFLSDSRWFYPVPCFKLPLSPKEYQNYITGPDLSYKTIWV